MKFKIACIQINPEIGKLSLNIKKVESLVSKLVANPKYTSIDLLLLPEFALSGYNFKSRKHIEPYLEPTGSGASFNLASRLSKQLKCFTLIGYPEINQNLIYNSALLTSPAGELLYNYRKTHLYETDEGFECNENPNKSFESIQLVADKNYYLNPAENKSYPTITTNFGICMDLNPYQFKAPFNAFEMSLKCYMNNAKLILCPLNWLSQKSPSINDSLSPEAKKDESNQYSKHFINGLQVINTSAESQPPVESIEKFDPKISSLETIDYWILRFFPFLKHPYNQLPLKPHKTTVVINNRVGLEDDVLYGGSSTIFQFDGNSPGNDLIDSTNPSVDIVGSLSMGEEGVLYREVDLDLD